MADLEAKHYCIIIRKRLCLDNGLQQNKKHMKVIVLNCGSSSIKYQFFGMPEKTVLAKGIVDKIGLRGSFVKHSMESGEKVMLEGEILDHKQGIEYVLGILTSEKYGCVKNLEEITAVGHRVAHGAENFSESQEITNAVIKGIEEAAELAPLHNPPNLQGIYAMKNLLPQVKQVAVFDTAFHQTIPARAYLYGLPYSLYKKHKVRRYAFHGTSHRYVAKLACEANDMDMGNAKIITCHLGNGASITAIKNGESIDSTMGMTPVEGLVMGTRVGDIDAGALLYVMQKEEININIANTLINKHSGMLGLSGVSSDMREIEMASYQGNERAITALDVYQYRVKKYIGSYMAAMGGLDMIVFTGGIGENDANTRKLVLNGLEFLGFEQNTQVQDVRGELTELSTPESRVKVMLVPTNEELVIATDTYDIVKNESK